ncbi:MAG: MerR family transcriptional regulator [Deltaproteobacteria bacterium]|nr:MerR family transcriptional regulator [Deltaproteobacteria bacterium]
MDKLAVSEVAKKLGCHPETVRRLERRGVLKAKRDYRNSRVFDLAEVLKVKAEREALRGVEVDIVEGKEHCRN